MKRYSASIIISSGPGKGNSRDSKTFSAVDDDDAWAMAMDWAAKNPMVDDGDYLQLSANGRGVKGAALKRAP
jgi:hypothetical protein